MAKITIDAEEHNRLKSELERLRRREEALEEQCRNKNIALERAYSVLYAESRARHSREHPWGSGDGNPND